MPLDKQHLYRLPWSMNDNPIGWLEVTDVCNLHCHGCYRQKLEGDKTLEQVKEEVLFLKRWRNCDNISIAGGEPLLHPQIVEIVRFIAQNGIKPTILTNGAKLDRPMMRELSRAGLASIAFHVDSFQGRPSWKDADERALCELRQDLVDVVMAEGPVPLSFGITVYRQNFEQIPDIIRWIIKNRRIVAAGTFITYRAAMTDLEYSVGDKSIKLDEAALGYATSDRTEDIGISSEDVYALIRKHFPEYDACSYLGGTIKHTSIKWLIGVMMLADGEPVGHLGPRAMEFGQTMHHLLWGTYLVYKTEVELGRKSLLMAALDPDVRAVAKRYLRKPINLFKPLYGVSIGIIQAPDLLEDGRADMCDSCPDMTYFDGKLVNSCRLDEYRKFGQMMTATSKAAGSAES